MQAGKLMVLLSELTVKVARKIEVFPPEDWNSVFPAVLENYSFFKSIDESSFEQFSFFYILVYDSSTPIAATSCFTMRFPLDVTVRGPLRTIFGLIKKILPNIFSPKTLICGLPMGQGRIGIVRDHGRVIDAITSCIERLAGEQKCSMIMFKDFNSGYNDTLKPLRDRGFSIVESLPSTDMNITFDSFESYLKILSRSSRDNLKRNLKKADAEEKIVFEIKDDLEDHEFSRVYGLYLQTCERQEISLEKLPADFFKTVTRNMPQEAKYFLWRIDGKIVAFALCFISKEHFIDYYLGFDYVVINRYFLYFVRFRDLIKWCISHGIKKYEMGPTSYEAKRRLGFEFIRLYLYMKHRNKFFNRFFGLVSPLLRPDRFDPVFAHMREAEERRNKKS